MTHTTEYAPSLIVRPLAVDERDGSGDLWAIEIETQPWTHHAQRSAYFKDARRHAETWMTYSDLAAARLGLIAAARHIAEGGS